MKICCREYVSVVLLYGIVFFYTGGPLMLPWNSSEESVLQQHPWKDTQPRRCPLGSFYMPWPIFQGAVCPPGHTSPVQEPLSIRAFLQPLSAECSGFWRTRGSITCSRGRQTHCSAVILSAALGSPDPCRDAAAVWQGLPSSAFFREHELVSLEPFHGHAILGGHFGQRAPTWSEVAGAGAISADLCLGLLVIPSSLGDVINRQKSTGEASHAKIAPFPSAVMPDLAWCSVMYVRKSSVSC